MNRRTSILALALAVAAPLAPARSAPAPAHTPAHTPAQTPAQTPALWRIDPGASHLGFVTSFGGVRVSGEFPVWDASIRFDPKDLAHSRVVAVIGMRRVRTGNADQEQALPTPTFFDAPAFPQARFEADHIVALGAGHYAASGTLTVRGASRPLTLPFTLAISGAQAAMTGEVTISRLAFGIGQNEWKATDTLPDPVQVTVTIHARRVP
ncbi:MAG: YceI family protein [Alphaproteobacteria bacterium]|nr:YceI family protein [Alphaproteobacteria bacterium]